MIRVAADTDWAPIEFVDEDGEFRGISIDYLNRISKMLGVEFQFKKDVTWQEAVDAVDSGELDIFSSVARTAKRDARYNFTTPYLSMPINIFAGGDVTYIGDLNALEGKRVAVVEGYAIHEWLRDAVEVGDLTALSEMASELKARADAASAYGEKIGRLTDGFDFDGLLNLAVTLDKEQSAGLAGVMGTHKTAS